MPTESHMRPKKHVQKPTNYMNLKSLYDERISAEKNQLMKKERIVMSVPVRIFSSREQFHPFEKM
jgi:hypothetical protein